MKWKLEEQEIGSTLKLRSPHGCIAALDIFILHSKKRSSLSILFARSATGGINLRDKRDVQPYEGCVSRLWQKSPAFIIRL